MERLPDAVQWSMNKENEEHQYIEIKVTYLPPPREQMFYKR